MNTETMRNYAKIIVQMGVNVQPGQDVELVASTDQADLAVMVVEECYSRGARKVRVKWNHDLISRLNLENESVETLGECTRQLIGQYEDKVERPPVGIYIDDQDPNVFDGVDNEKLTTPQQMRYPFTKPYLDKLSGQAQWTIVAMPSVGWARKMYPDHSDEEAMKLLEEAILHTMRMDRENPVESWKQHIDNLQKKAEQMNRYRFRSLHYMSSNGTDFKVDLHPDHQWCTAWETQKNGISSCVNMPTEEVFTIPELHSANGVVVASKPLSYNGNLIEDFRFTFENGKVASVQAGKGQEHLEKMIAMDEGASYLGELALVPYDSPINQVGALFYNTLFDENAVCHIALGDGIDDGLIGHETMSVEEIKKSGVNESMIHVDFMIGSEDMRIVGTQQDGTEVVVFDNGTWAIES